MDSLGVRAAMIYCATLVALAGMHLSSGVVALAWGSNVNPHALELEEFQKGIVGYVALHKNTAAHLAPLKPSESAQKILLYQQALVERIRAGRPHAKQGDLFTPSVAREFRKIIRRTMQKQQGERIRNSLRHVEPVKVKIAVNGVYPAPVPAETTPSSLLLNLPELPPEVAYRVVGQDLVLLDVTANLIVDYLPHAIP